MGILGIENRTENWKTVEHFYGLSDDAKVKLVTRLLGEKPDVQAKDIHMELFWQGMRDYFKLLKRNGESEPSADCIAKLYEDHFDGLRHYVKQFIEKRNDVKYAFRALKPHNYKGSGIEFRKDGKMQSTQAELKSNLGHTEIDIVLETRTHLFVGEAKDSSNLGTKGSYVLVHQLIRQYVMACILVALKQEELKVVPFVVGENLTSLNKTAQVQFMIQQGKKCTEQGWLKESNVLSWRKIKDLTKPDSA